MDGSWYLVIRSLLDPQACLVPLGPGRRKKAHSYYSIVFCLCLSYHPDSDCYSTTKSSPFQATKRTEPLYHPTVMWAAFLLGSPIPYSCSCLSGLGSVSGSFLRAKRPNAVFPSYPSQDCTHLKLKVLFPGGKAEFVTFPSLWQNTQLEGGRISIGSEFRGWSPLCEHSLAAGVLWFVSGACDTTSYKGQLGSKDWMEAGSCYPPCPLPNDLLLPVRPHLLRFPQPPTHHQLGTKHLNTRACRGHFTSKL